MRVDAATSSWAKWALVLCILLGFGLRGLEASRKSLWLDEYHTLYMADSADLGEIVEKGTSDVHPPAFFWALSLLRGVEPHGQRWFPIVLSMLTLIPLLAIARQGRLDQLALLGICGVFAFAPYQVQYGAELRSYAALQLISVTLVWAAMTARARPALRLAVFGIATALGLYVHYLTAVAVLCIGFVRCFVRPHGSLSLRALVLAGTVGVLAFVPWIHANEEWMFSDPREILEWPELSPQPESGVMATTMRKATAVPVRTIVPMIGSLGAPHAGWMRIAAAMLFALLGIGMLHLARRIRRRPSAAGSAVVWAALSVGCAGYVVTGLLCVLIWNRVPLQYFAVAAWSLPILVGLIVQCVPSTRAARALVALILVTCLTAGICHALGASRENTEEGVVAALHAAPGENAIYTALLWQPPWYPHLLPFRYCASDVCDSELDVRDPLEIPPVDAMRERRPIIVVTRKCQPEGTYANPTHWAAIRDGRRLSKTIQIDAAIRVYVFEPR